MASERKIIISAESSQVEAALDKIAEKGEKTFDKIADSAAKIDKATDGLDSSKFSKIEKEAAIAFKEILADSEKYTNSVRERSKFLESEIKQLERINRHEKARADEEAKERYSKRVRSVGGTNFRAEDREKIKEQYFEELSENQTKARIAEIHIASLKEKKADYDKRQDSIVDEDDFDDKDSGGRKSGFLRRSFSSAGGLVSSLAKGVAQGLGFGAVLSIGGFVGKMIQEGQSLQVAQARSGAMGVRGGSVSGLKIADELEYSKNIALQVGRGNVSRLATEQGQIERGTGMELGSMNPFHTVMRSEVQQGKTLTDATVEMLSIMKKSGLYGISKGDFTMTHELLQRQNTLNELQANQAEAISSRSSSQLLAAFGSIGGSFGDQRQGQTLSGINQSIINPGNEFKKAFILRSIKRNNPNASLLDIMTDQEKGIFKAGQFESIMKDLSDTFSGDQRVFSVSKMFGLRLSQAKSLTQKFDENPELFSQVGSEEELKKLITPESLAKRGGVSEMEKRQADFDDWFAKKGSGAINTVSDWMKAYDKNGVGGLAGKMFGDVTSAIVSGFQKGIEIVKEGLNLSGNGIAGYLVNKLDPSRDRGGSEISGEEQKKQTSLAVELVKKNLVNDNLLDESDKEKKRKLLEDIQSGKGIYHPNSNKGADEILEVAKDQAKFLFDSYEAKGRKYRREEAEKDAIDFLDNDVLKGMSGLYSKEGLEKRDLFIQQAKEYPSGLIRLMNDFEKNNGEIKIKDLGVGKGSNQLLEVMKELLEIQKRMENKKAPETVENYSTKSVN